MGAVGIFWDYGAFPESFSASSLVLDALFSENCQYTAGRSGFDIAKNIEEQARGHGLVRTFNAYLDVQQGATPATLRSELQSSGVTLVDCPHNGQKNVVDLMLLSALCAFAPLSHVLTMIPGKLRLSHTRSPRSRHARLRAQRTCALDGCTRLG